MRSCRRKPLLPVKERIERLTRHFQGIEHFAGKQHLALKFNLENHFHLQHAVFICCWKQKLSTAETASVLGVSKDRVNFAVDRIIQNSQ